MNLEEAMKKENDEDKYAKKGADCHAALISCSLDSISIPDIQVYFLMHFQLRSINFFFFLFALVEVTENR